MRLNNTEILLTEPRGFCAGVERAIEIVNRAVEIFDETIYVKHEVVHNKQVIEKLVEKGVVFVDSLDIVPDESILIYSAHGVSKEISDSAKKKRLKVFDATCPLVTKVHFEIHKFASQNVDVVLVGHSGHPEVEGTMGQYISEKGKIHLIETTNDIETLNIDNDKLAYVTQTTLSVDDTHNIVANLKKKFPNILGPRKDDICYATQNRQEAVKKILEFCDSLIVVGSQNSSNSQRLREIGVQYGIKSYLIDDINQISIDDLSGDKVVGITAGASAPEDTVESLVKFLLSKGAKMSNRNLSFKSENITFSIPKELRTTST
tara:strand:+ start:451 stop:1407 length:957 start_codon:yes stop_codon:yes gene_type:complete